jgi:hypothetical protein
MKPETTAAFGTSDERASAVRGRMREIAEDLAIVLRQSADTLEHSAMLADEHAQRRERAGHSAGALEERNAAQRARQAAQRARSRAQFLSERAQAGGRYNS